MMQRIVVTAMGGLCLALGGIVVVEALGANRAALPTGSTLARALPQAGATAPAADPQVLEAVLLARPLFSKTRRPQAVVAVANMAPGGMPRLSGIVITPIGRLAIFAPAGGQPIVTHQGSRVGRFTIRTIGPDWVSVVGPHGVEIVRTAFSAANVASAVPTPQPAAGATLGMPHFAPGVVHTAGGISFDPSKPDLPSAATWSGPPGLSRLPPPPHPPAASAPLLQPSPNPSGPPG